ncbi:MAG: hypothetical protein LBQ83_01095 [Candidatus Margulisbacteria bacterium]|jgi:hypothetical protein|nr:hypothetical protein [Candidatus Margulisiibacteriota bacterium]
MKRLLFIALLALGALLPAATEYIVPGLTYFRGTAAHILEDQDAENPRRLVKVRLDKNSQKDIVLIEMPDGQRLQVGDRILVRKIDDNFNYGLDSSFEEKFVFWDFARDRALWLTLFILGPGLLLVNKKTGLYIVAILSNILLLFFILPFCLNRQIHLFWFILLFYLSNTLLAYFLLNSQKILPAAGAALVGSAASGVVYALLIRAFHLAPFKQLGQSAGFAFFNFSPYTDVYILIVMCFYLCLFVTIFLLRVSFHHSLYQNIQLFFFKNTLLFFFIAAGLLLPYSLYFQLNNLGLFYLFNYAPFIYLFEKLALCLLAIQLSCLAYSLYYYAQNRPAFDRQAALRELKAAPAVKPVSLRRILQEHQQIPPKKPRRRKGKKV